MYRYWEYQSFQDRICCVWQVDLCKITTELPHFPNRNILNLILVNCCHLLSLVAQCQVLKICNTVTIFDLGIGL